MKKNIVILFVLLFIVSCGSNNEANEDSETKDTASTMATIQNDSLEISAQYPEGWNVVSQDNGFIVTDMEGVELSYDLSQTHRDIDGVMITVINEELSQADLETIILPMANGNPNGFMLSLLSNQLGGRVMAKNGTAEKFAGLDAVYAQEIIERGGKDVEATYVATYDETREQFYYFFAFDSTQEQDELVMDVLQSIEFIE